MSAHPEMASFETIRLEWRCHFNDHANMYQEFVLKNPINGIHQ
jgi:hypothetical protein